MKKETYGPKLILLLLGTAPFLAGSLLNSAMELQTDEVPPFKIFGIGTLLLWALVAYIMRPKMKNMEELFVWQNLIPFLDLVLLFVQEILLRSYWDSAAGAWTQFYYLPVLTFGFSLTQWTGRIFAAYIASFLLMIAASFFGGKAKEGRSEDHE